MPAIAILTACFIAMLAIMSVLTVARRWNVADAVHFHIVSAFAWAVVLFFVFASLVSPLVGVDAANSDETVEKRVTSVSADDKFIRIGTDDGEELSLSKKRIEMGYDEDSDFTKLLVYHKRSDMWMCDTYSYELVMGGGA